MSDTGRTGTVRRQFTSPDTGKRLLVSLTLKDFLSHDTLLTRH